MTNCVQCDGVFVVIFFKTIYNLKKKKKKTIIGFGFCNKRSNQGVENWY